MKIAVTVTGIDERATRRMRDRLSDAMLRRARFGDDARRRGDRQVSNVSRPDDGERGETR